MGNYSAKLALLTNASASGVGVRTTYGGKHLLTINGTFGGTTAKLQVLGPDGTNYIDVPTASFTAAGAIIVDLPVNTTVKAVLTGGTPSAMYATLALVG